MGHMKRITGGLLIAVEGIDGAGKTTQAAAVADRLERWGYEVVRTKEPTDGPWGRLLRSSSGEGRLPPDAELDTFMQDRLEHVAEVIGPALARGAVVVVDRYYFSSIAYQGARGLDPEDIQRRNEQIAPVPDILVLMRPDAAVAVQRIQARRGGADLFEEESYLRRVAAIFDEVRTPGKLTVDSTCPHGTITAAILMRAAEVISMRATAITPRT